MVDRLRTLLDRPLDPSAARAILIAASGIFLGLAALFILAGSEPRPSASGQGPPPTIGSVHALPKSDAGGLLPGHRSPSPHIRQDPQDVAGSAAAKRAARALRSHRALQHLPYEVGEVVIVLAGARDSRAVLRVSAPTVSAARLGWRHFLRHYHDSGRAYLPVFHSLEDRRG